MLFCYFLCIIGFVGQHSNNTFWLATLNLTVFLIRTLVKSGSLSLPDAFESSLIASEDTVKC